MEASASSSTSSSPPQVVPHEFMESDGNEDPADALIISNKVTMDNKGKAIQMEYVHDLDHQKQVSAFPSSKADSELADGVSLIPLKSSGSGSGNTDDIDQDDDDDDMFNYDSDVSYGADFEDYDQTVAFQDHLDTGDLPPGVEASFPWLNQPSSSQIPAATDISTSSGKENDGEDEALQRFESFKQFDTVGDYSDHHYKDAASKTNQASQKWTRTIQNEWKILEKDLPDTIFVRVYEERMDLVRAVIVGAAGTPYHDGLFFFDAIFPLEYPNVPPKVNYHSFGHRINPNLYDNGMVCLSLLGTWSGEQTEQWIPEKSTMLQVLLSLQALVLNTKPYFNEPGYEHTAGNLDGERKSKSYSERAFILSCKTMLHLLKNKPKHFEDFVVGHFRTRAFAILMACKAYINGAEVGNPVQEVVTEDKDEKKDVDSDDDIRQMRMFGSFGRSFSSTFVKDVGLMAASLVPTFLQIGAKDCEQFIPLGDVNRPVVKKLY